ncbi:hypothetical protein TREMEDRAFT_66079 [Tremella mesenterica DSM 1558]|uniref:uncharacterized protein n=1 Tax=Tremella mesenterica (strain ATCC 24925 / CBS 8224 / DSM 1558 / NBRC 9311 / NRRL Y-6157 / RJB 2259-6 / UBC 559-6) TaxID=578456 RepID=UPI00032BA46B|nr:uncharacterized protein TREMEDRAFT_66079 [Tremella mesenterica DSM 1558]EIW65989.1 hypothetical protein TREMEDRAFT_66079 [Tremella mesenterica DSM 1558]
MHGIIDSDITVMTTCIEVASSGNIQSPPLPATDKHYQPPLSTLHSHSMDMSAEFFWGPVSQVKSQKEEFISNIRTMIPGLAGMLDPNTLKAGHDTYPSRLEITRVPHVENLYRVWISDLKWARDSSGLMRLMAAFDAIERCPTVPCRFGYVEFQPGTLAYYTRVQENADSRQTMEDWRAWVDGL